VPERPYTMLSCCVSLDGYLGDQTPRLALSNEADFDRVRPHERAAEDPAWQARDVIALECLERRHRDLRRIGDVPQRHAAALAGVHDLAGILTAGSVRLAPVYATLFFGALLSRVVLSTGIAETLVTYAAEFGGDRPVVLSLLLCAVVAVLFTAVTGLGAIIMIGTIVLPVLMTVGVALVARDCLEAAGRPPLHTLSLVYESFPGQAREGPYLEAVLRRPRGFLARPFGRRSPDDVHIITTAVEHPATLQPVEFLRRLGAEVTIIPVDKFGMVDPGDVKRAITSRTPSLQMSLVDKLRPICRSQTSPVRCGSASRWYAMAPSTRAPCP